MIRMVVTRDKGLKYDTRRLQAGDEFDAHERRADFFERIKWAARVAGPRPTTKIEQVVGDDVAVLRAECASLGIRPDNRWGIKRLTAEIALARSQRRSLV